MDLLTLFVRLLEFLTAIEKPAVRAFKIAKKNCSVLSGHAKAHAADAVHL